MVVFAGIDIGIIRGRTRISRVVFIVGDGEEVRLLGDDVEYVFDGDVG